VDYQGIVVQPLAEVRRFFVKNAHKHSRPCPASYILGVESVFSETNWPGHEADHSP